MIESLRPTFQKSCLASPRLRRNKALRFRLCGVYSVVWWSCNRVFLRIISGFRARSLEVRFDFIAWSFIPFDCRSDSTSCFLLCQRRWHSISQYVSLDDVQIVLHERQVVSARWTVFASDALRLRLVVTSLETFLQTNADLPTDRFSGCLVDKSFHVDEDLLFSLLTTSGRSICSLCCVWTRRASLSYSSVVLFVERQTSLLSRERLYLSMSDQTTRTAHSTHQSSST